MVNTDQGKVLIELIEDKGFKRVAEVGIWKGHTTRMVLRACKDIESYWAVDPWAGMPKGRMAKVTEEDWDFLHKRLCEDMYYFPALRVLRMPSVRAASIFPERYFDLVFIDASHDYADVERDILSWSPLIRKGGLLTGHDYGFRRTPDIKKAVDKLLGEVSVIKKATVWVKEIND